MKNIKSVVKTLLTRSVIGRLFMLMRLDHKSRKSDPSFAGEHKALKDLARRSNISNGYIVDVAASDGYTQSPTLEFFREGWVGFSVEMDPIKFSCLSFLYAKFPKVSLLRNRVTPQNIAALLEGCEAPKDIDILNLDIDSYDLYVIKSMLENGWRPKIISMEINEKIPAGVFFTVDYDDRHYWQGDHFYGCSIDAAAMVVKSFGYKLTSLEYNNAMFVREDVAHVDLIDLSPENAYANGYKNKPDRSRMFPWNENVKAWVEGTPSEAVAMIDDFFEGYRGKYTLMLSSDFVKLGT